MKNVSQCPYCGQDRPYPTEPGEWEYKEFPTLPDMQWWPCKIIRDIEGLLFYPMDEFGDYPRPEHWPNNAQWRQRNEKDSD